MSANGLPEVGKGTRMFWQDLARYRDKPACCSVVQDGSVSVLNTCGEMTTATASPFYMQPHPAFGMLHVQIGFGVARECPFVMIRAHVHVCVRGSF